MFKRSNFFPYIFVTLITLSFSFITANLTFAAYPDGVISHWKLDEMDPGVPDGTYEDAFNENHGVGAISPAAAAGRVNGAQQFDGVASGIDVPADGSLNWLSNQSFSIEYWVKIETGIPSSNQVVIGRFDSTTDLFWFVGVEKVTGLATFELDDTGGISTTVGSAGSINLADGSWHHVVAVRDDGIATNLIFVDGVLQDSKVWDYTGGFSSDTAKLNIGWLNFRDRFHLQGSIDELALYNRALTDAEIQQHYDAGLRGQGIETLIIEPVADAGADQIVFDEITLDGSLSTHPEGLIISYQWQLNHRQNPGFDKTASGVNPTVSYLKKGFYDVTLIVEDDKGRTGTDQMLFSATGLKGDFDFDGDVDGYDLAVFVGYYGIIK